MPNHLAVLALHLIPHPGDTDLELEPSLLPQEENGHLSDQDHHLPSDLVQGDIISQGGHLPQEDI